MEVESETAVDDTDPKNPCAECWKNLGDDASKTMWGVFEETGFFLCLCRHRFVLTCCDMIRSGEL
jgi:hypothetical protein